MSTHGPSRPHARSSPAGAPAGSHAGHAPHGRAPASAARHRMTTAQAALCIDECRACADQCTAAIAHCLAVGGPHADARHVTLLLDCAAFCRLSADLILRRSTFHDPACATCAEVCRACEASCRQFDDAVMRASATAGARRAECCAAVAGLS